MNIFWGWLLSADVLQTLFDGLLGAGVGAAVAVVVLRLTLREQRVGLTQQLDKQDTHHQEQLRVQREENSRARMHDVVARLLNTLVESQDLFELSTTQKPFDELPRLKSQFAVGLESFHLEVPADEKDMYFAIRELGIRAFEEVEKCLMDEYEAATPENVQRLFGWMGAVLVIWVRGSTDERSEMLAGVKYTNAYLETKSLDEWEQLSRDEKLGKARVGLEQAV
ncbi:hypothetical protein LVY72_12325 [Arthrobacter sp. I2-34]|uniref:Uncharacterized protein n=1 Tax=Arthrobacter hankyongi TaxID=2904801 RepID=A0ABS9L7P4_9MICC|nr:hypothetical protein [Arthrobacter hankyongi]MCG2622689.1 hypothetical protein [Arthrobacter hankyongi]